VGNESFFWYPSTGITVNTIYNPVATPPDTMQYCVIATGYNGCLDTACVDVLVVIPEPSIQIPTAFTPNGDGKNDTWQLIINPCYTLIDVIVYNRWGQMVFNLKNHGNSDWNGTYNGAPEPNRFLYLLH
jgi:gliding motility-associated-like protein